MSSKRCTHTCHIILASAGPRSCSVTYFLHSNFLFLTPLLTRIFFVVSPTILRLARFASASSQLVCLYIFIQVITIIQSYPSLLSLIGLSCFHSCSCLCL